ncbi:hypothetical protein IEQ34_010015 [Dendrobium chrysotoxum]|uniref:F-box protein n=1 Tax=Dendrobium chrysotoxum TaxID=161865 RepID=A0AAV7H4L0_DENCH|nr:hypothetical protein IEQ34_010015 [Dendrobium chrysotoxum]
MGLCCSKYLRLFRAQQSNRKRGEGTMRRPRDHLGEPMLPSKRKARVDEELFQKARKKERSLSCTSPLLSCLTRHSEFSWYEENLWIEVAKCLDGKDLIRLAVLSPHHVSFKWFQLYASAFDGSHVYCFRQKEKHIELLMIDLVVKLDWMRIGAFLIETPSAMLTEKLALPSKLMELEEDHNRAIQLSGTCILTDIRTGIWIADLQLVRCPVCNLNTCEGTMQILDVRHLELFLEESFRNGSWQFEDIGSHRIEKQSNSASGGVFDYKHIHSPCTAGLLNTSGWLADPGDWQPRARISTHAVAVNTNLQPNDGLHVRFQAMRSKGSDGKVVSIRISQQLI